MDIVGKLDMFINEEEVGSRPIQFRKYWNDFRPGDRADVYITNDYIHIICAGAEGNFAGAKKEVTLEDMDEMSEFLSLERDAWNYV